MIPKKLKDLLEKQHYSIFCGHCALQVCRWCKHSLLDEGVCYKEQFYGIKSHKCCQISPAVAWCQNKCVHCWRPIELSLGSEMKGNLAEPKEIIFNSIQAQKKRLTGFKSNKKINMEKWEEAQEPDQFAISLIGEPLIYPKMIELINELRKQKKSSFIVTNGLVPERLKEMIDKKVFPTQIYISLNCPNKKMYEEWHKSCEKDAWKKFNESLGLLKDIRKKGGRTVLRMTLVRDLNMNEKMIDEYVKLIKKASPQFLELKSYMAVGYARNRLGYERMPFHEEIKEFAEKLSKKLKMKVLDEHEFSRVVLLGRKKGDMKISKV
ncbi:MAG: 4-demethylwyosine synthase TYW1 [Nanoarchaeota archaeon]|nr:4-demethylwyosine synthase TYW1 [Nanoarchaeota archaeon]